jgi:hypothetical protein
VKLATALACACLAAACSTKTAPPAPSTVHTLRLPGDDVVLPDGPGRDRVTSACVACHTPRYVLDQPPLPRKTWEAEVDKMRKTYGAPVAEQDVPAIVDYLVAIRGPAGGGG